MRSTNRGYWILFGLVILLLLTVSILVIIVGCQKLEIKNMAIISADEVGIASIDQEDINSAKFDSHIPEYTYRISDFRIVEDVLGTLEGATFQKCPKPINISWIEAISIETDAHTYYIGVENGVLRITIDGVTNYYRCSQKAEFIEKICAIQGR